MQQAVACKVIDVLAASAQEARVLDALDRTADQHVRLVDALHSYRPARSRAKGRTPVFAGYGAGTQESQVLTQPVRSLGPRLRGDERSYVSASCCPTHAGHRSAGCRAASTARTAP